MKKRDIPRIIFISLVALMLAMQLLVNINPRNFINSQFYQRYPERTVYVQELAVMDILLHNFTLNEDESITTTDSESWIALFYGQTEIYRDNLSNVNFKYSVPLVAYSNYKDIKMDVDTISPNQIATQIIKDSGIKHHSYMDYIYSLRTTTPVLQKEYTGELEDETIDMYRAIQYDLIFGRKYCLESD